MKYYPLAHASQPIELPAIGFGAMGISEFYGETDQRAALAAVECALSQGINHFDTADNYAFGANERWLRLALTLENERLRRTRLVASKAGLVRDEANSALRDISIDPVYLRGQLLRSLNNLGTTYLDLFYIHRLPPAASEAELAELSDHLALWRAEGRIRAIGISEPSLAQLQFLHARTPLSMVQSEYSLLERSVEHNGILDFCRANDILFVAYSPLSRGLLSGAFNPDALAENDFRRSLPRFNGDNFVHNAHIVDGLNQLAQQKQVSLATFSLAWLLAQQVAVIPGMRKPQRVEEALAALTVNFTAQERAVIDALAPPNATRGERYSVAANKVYGFAPSS